MSEEADADTYHVDQSEVPGLVALAALHTLGRARLRTSLGVVTLLLAVTCAVTLFRAVDIMNGRCHRDVLRLPLLAVLRCVSNLTTSRVVFGY